MSDDENAELVHDWESDCYVLRDEITRLRAENERLREALGYYAEEDYNGYNGSGACARAALKETRNE